MAKAPYGHTFTGLSATHPVRSVPMRFSGWVLSFVVVLLMHGQAAAEPWATSDPKAAGWSMQGLGAVEEAPRR